MRASTYDGSLISVSDIVQYFYCPRKVYYLKVLGVPVKARRKMDYGMKIQERERRRLKERKAVYGLEREGVENVLHKLHVEAPEIGLYGQIDTVLKMRDGELIPVETKYTDQVRVYRSFRKQIVAYALLLDHKFGVNTTRGMIHFPQQRSFKELRITAEEKRAVLRDVDKIRLLIASEDIPRKVSKEKCSYCEVRRYCV